MNTAEKYIVTKNACKLCTPLGACLAFKGIENTIPLLHGSQGCATYIRRYMISHYKEPMDIASSSFTESTAIFGGKDNLFTGIKNVARQYNPDVIGIATTCLSETIGDDVKLYIKEFQKENNLPGMPKLVAVSTPSYNGTHVSGYFDTLREIADALAEGGEQSKHINIIPNMVSPEDIRHLREILNDFKLPHVLLPDYSETIDGTNWEEYQQIPEGGTPINDIEKMGNAAATIEFTSTFNPERTAGHLLDKKFQVENHKMDMPVGIRLTDQFFNLLGKITNRSMPVKHQKERGRLLDAYVDAHKYVFGKKAIVYGDQDFIVSMVSFLSETGIIPVLCATGANTGVLNSRIKEVASDIADQIRVIEDSDFGDIESLAEILEPDLLIGNSKAYKISRKLNVPLIRIGFPIHDRFGGSRILHLGYRGTQQLFDRIVNAIIQKTQDDSPVGYSYM